LHEIGKKAAGYPNIDEDMLVDFFVSVEMIVEVCRCVFAY
jgi:hypothetical protein